MCFRPSCGWRIPGGKQRSQPWWSLDFSQASGHLIKIWGNERNPEDMMEKYGKLGEVIEEYGNNMENTSEKKWETMENHGGLMWKTWEHVGNHCGKHQRKYVKLSMFNPKIVDNHRT